MTDLISRELRETGLMFMAGISVMIVLETRRIIVNQLKLEGRIEKFIYLISWICASYVFSEIAYLACFGRLSWYGIIAFTMGIGLWKKLKCDTMKLPISLITKEQKDKGYEKKKKV